MAALPPFHRPPRARRGSLDRPVNGRMYRGAWLLVGIPLLLSAFTVFPPRALHPPLLQPEFDGNAAKAVAQDFTNRYPDRTPGSDGARQATKWVSDQLAQYGFHSEIDRFYGKIPGRGTVELQNLLAFRQGRSAQVIAVVAHRDNSGNGPGANDNASGTAALLELAQLYASPRTAPQAPEPRYTILFLSTDGGAFGGLGADRFARQSPFRDRVVAVINLDAIAGPGRPHLAFNGDRPRGPSPALVRAAVDRIVEQTGSEPTRASALDQLLDLAFPFSLYEHAPFVDRGIAAITLTSAGDRLPASFSDNPDRLNGRRL